MSDVVWSINIMLALLLVAVGVSIYYIFMYDTWYPNDGTEHGDQDSSLGSEGGSYDEPHEGANP
tara:strand:+ start:1070 stop:1261 length:192 start_codon:yes stop_codon:yes gene_type:complete